MYFLQFWRLGISGQGLRFALQSPEVAQSIGHKVRQNKQVQGAHFYNKAPASITCPSHMTTGLSWPITSPGSNSPNQ